MSPISPVDLWLPILVSSVAVFFASFLVWMVLPHHKADIKKLPDEKALTAKLNELNIPPGTYMWPNCETKEEMGSEEFKARLHAGPWGSINIMRAEPSFGRNLALTFTFYVIVSAFVAYITGEARAPGAAFASVFQVAGATAILGYCAGGIPGAFFFAKPVRFMMTELIDGIAYGLITAAIFAWLWPGGAG